MQAFLTRRHERTGVLCGLTGPGPNTGIPRSSLGPQKMSLHTTGSRWSFSHSQVRHLPLEDKLSSVALFALTGHAALFMCIVPEYVNVCDVTWKVCMLAYQLPQPVQCMNHWMALLQHHDIRAAHSSCYTQQLARQLTCQQLPNLTPLPTPTPRLAHFADPAVVHHANFCVCIADLHNLTPLYS